MAQSSVQVTENNIRVGVLTVSDSCHAGQASDTSGPNLCHLTETLINNGIVVTKAVVPDEEADIKNKLIEWSDKEHLNVIFTTGGTGFAPRDVTPEATKAVLEKEAPGLTIAMLKSSLDVTPMAMLSRLACGIRGNTVIVNLPGSKKGSEECFRFVLPAIPHAVDLLKGHKKQVADTHKVVQAQEGISKTQGKMTASAATPPKQIKLIVRNKESLASQQNQKSGLGIQTRNGQLDKKFEKSSAVCIVRKGLNKSANKSSIQAATTHHVESGSVNTANSVEKKEGVVVIQSKLWNNAGMTVNELLKRKRGCVNQTGQGQKEASERVSQNTVTGNDGSGRSVNETNSGCSVQSGSSEKSKISPKNKIQPEKMLYRMPRTRAQRKLYVQQHFLERTNSDAENLQSQDKINTGKSGSVRKEYQSFASLKESRTAAFNAKLLDNSENFMQGDDGNEVISFTTDMYSDNDVAATGTISSDESVHKDLTAELQSNKSHATELGNQPEYTQRAQAISSKPSFSQNDQEIIDKLPVSEETFDLSDDDDYDLEPGSVEAMDSDPGTQLDDVSENYVYTMACPDAAKDTFTVQDFTCFKEKRNTTQNMDNSRIKDTSGCVPENTETRGLVANNIDGNGFVSDAVMSEMEADSAQILYELSQRSVSRKESANNLPNLEINEMEFNKPDDKINQNSTEGTQSIGKRRIKSTKAVRHKTQESEVSFAQVGESAKIFLQKHPLLRGIYLNKGKREVKRHLIQLIRHKSAIDKGSYLRNGKINDKNRIDDMFEYTEEGKRRKDAIDENIARDEYVVNWYMWCPGHGNCLRKCGGYGQCVKGCQGLRHKQDRHNCSLMLTWKLYLSDLEKWQIHITGSHIPVESKVNWILPAPVYQRLDEDTRDLILKYKDKKDTSSIEQMLASKKDIPCGRTVPSSLKIKRFMQNKRKYRCAEQKQRSVFKRVNVHTEKDIQDAAFQTASQEIFSPPTPNNEVVVENVGEDTNSSASYYEAVPLSVNQQQAVTDMIPQVANVNEQGLNVLGTPGSVPHIEIHHNATGRNIFINSEELVPSCTDPQELVSKSGVITPHQQILTGTEQCFSGNQPVMPDMTGTQLPDVNQLAGSQPGAILAGQIPHIFQGDQMSMVPQTVQMVPPPDFGEFALPCLLFMQQQQQQQQQQ